MSPPIIVLFPRENVNPIAIYKLLSEIQSLERCSRIIKSVMLRNSEKNFPHYFSKFEEDPYDAISIWESKDGSSPRIFERCVNSLNALPCSVRSPFEDLQNSDDCKHNDEFIHDMRTESTCPRSNGYRDSIDTDKDNYIEPAGAVLMNSESIRIGFPPPSNVPVTTLNNFDEEEKIHFTSLSAISGEYICSSSSSQKSYASAESHFFQVADYDEPFGKEEYQANGDWGRTEDFVKIAVSNVLDSNNISHGHKKVIEKDDDDELHVHCSGSTSSLSMRNAERKHTSRSRSNFRCTKCPLKQRLVCHSVSVMAFHVLRHVHGNLKIFCCLHCPFTSNFETNMRIRHMEKIHHKYAVKKGMDYCLNWKSVDVKSIRAFCRLFVAGRNSNLVYDYIEKQIQNQKNLK